MAANLAPVFVNDNRVTLAGDPKPKVEKIVNAVGKNPQSVEIVRLRNQGDYEGKPLRLDEFIDRTVKSSDPVYLRCYEKGAKTKGGETATAPSPGTMAAPEPGFAATGPGTPGWGQEHPNP